MISQRSDHLAHGAGRGAAIRGECGEVLGHGGSCYVGDDTRCGSRALTLRRQAIELRISLGSKTRFGSPSMCGGQASSGAVLTLKGRSSLYVSHVQRVGWHVRAGFGRSDLLDFLEARSFRCYT